MKNEKWNVAIIAIIIVILVIISIIIAIKTQSPAQQTVITQPAAQTQSEIQKVIESFTYVNKSFGFQLKLPTNFSGYKVTETDSIGGKTKYLNFYLPTGDKNWNEDFFGDEHVGYARLFSILLTPLGDWTEEINNCKNSENNRILCSSEETVLAKINGYALDYYGATSEAQDLTDINITEEYLKSNLKPIN